MKVQILVPEYRTADAIASGGDELDLPDKEARRLIQRGYAAEVGEKAKTSANKAKTPANKEA